MKPLARFVGAVPDHDHPIELHDLLLEAEQLIAERGKARAGNLRHPFVTRVGNNVEQLGYSFAPDRRDDTKFGKVSPDRIDHRGLLANKQMPCAVKHQAALLLRGLGGHKPHVGSGDSLTDGLGISGVILLPLDVRLHVGRRHQSYSVPQCLELA